MSAYAVSVSFQRCLKEEIGRGVLAAFARLAVCLLSCKREGARHRDIERDERDQRGGRKNVYANSTEVNIVVAVNNRR